MSARVVVCFYKRLLAQAVEMYEIAGITRERGEIRLTVIYYLERGSQASDPSPRLRRMITFNTSIEFIRSVS